MICNHDVDVVNHGLSLFHGRDIWTTGTSTSG